MSSDLQTGDRVYYLSRPSRTGTVRMNNGRCIQVQLDTPEGDLSWVETTPALWRKV